MTREALIKLFILILLAFIICLPEFFTSHRARVNFHCVTFDPCGDQEVPTQCDPGLTPAEQNSNRSGEEKPICNTGRAGSGVSWLLCDTETDPPTLRGNASLSGEWLCVFRVAWLVLVVVVMLTVLTTVLGLIYWRTRCCRKEPRVYPASVFQTRGFNTDLPGVSVSLNHSSGTSLSPLPEGPSGFRTRGFNTDLPDVSVSLNHSSELLLRTTYWTGLLSPIHEEKTAEDEPRQGYYGNDTALHHRSHPLHSSLSPEEL
ncbi:uncharacterized protein si:dkey-192k22.2 isoform X9 [Oncorhynchus kisutch]|uniref:uncharacterized protein si:dkey-192k22.2 isoform X9 n=1 Tax=Oncorhynchus kisutch TaxID=8019 RepID=UPI0012DED8A8|nr:uncharacterized protein LOC116360165 isoform X9 [Oncorhynchus kisutch]